MLVRVKSGMPPISHMLRLKSARRFRATAADSLNDGEALEEVVDEKVTPAQHAFSARLKLELDNKVLLQALTHKSYAHGQTPTNERLEFLGRKVASLYATEFLHLKYPVLPLMTMKDALDAFCNVKSLGKLGHQLGVEKVMRWKPAMGDEVEERRVVGERKVTGKTVLALVGALYHSKGARISRNFVHNHILSQKVDVPALMKLDEPKRLLTAMMKRKNMERPISRYFTLLIIRLERETGRNTNSPLFVVGVYSGRAKLGEGVASSLRMAEHRAAKDALITYYCTEISDIQLPSTVDSPEASISFFPPALADTPAIA